MVQAFVTRKAVKGATGLDFSIIQRATARVITSIQQERTKTPITERQQLVNRTLQPNLYYEDLTTSQKIVTRQLYDSYGYSDYVTATVWKKPETKMK